MIQEALFVFVTSVSCIALFGTLFSFTVFLSSQEIKENDKDASIFTMFTIDVCLVVLFMAQHSGLATKWYRSLMERLGLQAVTRSVYIFATAVVLQLLMLFWQPIPEISFWILDTSQAPLLWLFFNILHWVFWVVLFLEVLVMQPLELIGVQQVYDYIHGFYPSTYSLPRKLQKLMRNMPHPGSGCFIAILWLHPCMTFDRLILATVLTPYLCCGYGVTEGDYVYMKSYSNSTHTSRVSREESRLYYER